MGEIEPGYTRLHTDDPVSAVGHVKRSDDLQKFMRCLCHRML